MTCPSEADRCRAEHVAPKLSDAEQASADYEARCPVCRHGGFRISHASKSRYRHVWVCACRRCHCGPAAIRAELMRLGVRPGCLGGYGIDLKPATDPIGAAKLKEAVDLVLGWPGLDQSEMRIILAEARGDKVPDEYREFVRFAKGIGIGQANAYKVAGKMCRPPDCPPPPGEGGVDNQS
jgi:hypothetical protein